MHVGKSQYAFHPLPELPTRQSHAHLSPPALERQLFRLGKGTDNAKRKEPGKAYPLNTNDK